VNRRHFYFVAVAAALLVSLALWSCAPQPRPVPLERLDEAARAGAQAREGWLAALEAQGTVRVDGRATGRLPAVTMSARLASPDRVRLQCRWLLGVLADVAIQGDTLTAWMPSERLGIRIPELSDTLGIRTPALFLGRALTAGWQAPADAWQHARPDSGGAIVEWPEGDERWTLRVARDGRPRDITLARGEHSLTARYRSWHGDGVEAWPERIDVADGSGWLRLAFVLDEVRPQKAARPAWFALDLPDDARRLELDDLRRILAKRLPSR